MTQPTAIRERAIRDTIQALPDADEGAFVLRVGSMRGDILPAWGTRAREQALRQWYRNPSLWMVQSAFAGLINKWLATPWTLEGAATGINSGRYFQAVLRDAEFGAGWDQFWSMVWLDFLRQDGGAYIEVIAPGDPNQPIQERITGLAHLDSLRCYPTGDPEFPVIYYNADGTKHKLHTDRVIHLVDMPDGDEFARGYGLCALSRIIENAMLMYYMGRYNRQQMDELPAPGFGFLRGMTREKFEEAVDGYVERKSRDLPPPYGNLIIMPSLLKAGDGASLEIVSFSQAPSSFDFPKWVDVMYDAVAVGLGVDRQELAQLTGGSLGSGAQSEVLHQKSQGRMYGHMLSLAERNLNDVLPESAELTFEPSDNYESQESATVAKTWADAVSSFADTTAQERRQLMVNTVEQYKDVLTDENGELVELDDADVETEQQSVMTDATPLEAGAASPANGQQVTTDSQNTQAAKAYKAIQSTRLDFEAAFEDLLSGAKDGSVNRRRFGLLLRSLISKYGRAAYKDGLTDGGIGDAALDAEDRAALAVELAKQSAYVTAFADTLYKDTQATIDVPGKAAMWFGGSISPFYDAGVLSADRNGYYQWHLGAAEEHCHDCPRLDGQIHRFKDWARKSLIPGRPGAQSTECGGWNCACSFSKANPGARASGNWLGSHKAVKAGFDPNQQAKTDKKP